MTTRSARVKPLDHVVTDLAVAVDDSEGFWTQGRPLTPTEIEEFNNLTRDRATSVIRRNPDGRWLVTAGGGRHYFAEVATNCQGCERTLWFEEAAGVYRPWHDGCYDPADDGEEA